MGEGGISGDEDREPEVTSMEQGGLAPGAAGLCTGSVGMASGGDFAVAGRVVGTDMLHAAADGRREGTGDDACRGPAVAGRVLAPAAGGVHDGQGVPGGRMPADTGREHWVGGCDS